jgi:hypothetical protein
MLIRVLHRNGTYELVNHGSLDTYIGSGNVLLFKRSNGWVTIGTDPIRVSERQFIGPERRRDA